MSTRLTRVYKNAVFVTDKSTRASAFFEGPLAREALALLDDPSYTLPPGLLSTFDPQDHPKVLVDFEEIRKAIASLSATGGEALPTASQPGGKSAMEMLSAFAVRNWQLVNVNLELTSVCNLRCRWCYLDNFDQRGLTTGRIETLAEELVAEGVIFLLLTGGEVFTRNNTVQILKDLDALFALEIKTNGTALTLKKIRELAEIRLYDIQVSVYETRTGYSDLTRSLYRFDRVMENVRELMKNGLPVTLSVLVGRHNIDRIQEIHDILSATGASVFYSPYINPNRRGPGPELEFRLSYREMEEKFKPFLERIKGFVPQKKYRDCRNSTPCFAGRDQIAIGPDGVVYPCLDLRLPLGNITGEPLSAVTARRKQVLSQFRFSEMGKCLSCHDRNYCDSCIGLSMIEHGNYRTPSKHKCDVVRFYGRERR